MFKRFLLKLGSSNTMLTKLLLGDSLAADYLICHLVSRVYHRRDVLCLGKFSLNLFNLPTAGNFTKRLATIFQLLTTKSHYLPMSVDLFNKGSFVPRKDYHENRLVSGLLQLSKGTHLILDETTMRDGQLTAGLVTSSILLKLTCNNQGSV